MENEPQPEPLEEAPEQLAAPEVSIEPAPEADFELNLAGDPEEPGQPIAEPEQAAQEEQQQAAINVVEAAGLSWKGLEDEFSQRGELSSDSLDKLQSIGITRDMVSAYVAGQMALADRMAHQLYEIAGGREQFEEMHTWARYSLEPAQRDAV